MGAKKEKNREKTLHLCFDNPNLRLPKKFKIKKKKNLKRNIARQ